MPKKIEYSQFINESKQIHHNKYIYNENDFNNKQKQTNKFKIICPIHGEFYENYYNHIKLKRGCPECHKITKQKEHEKYIVKLIEKAKKIHNNFYDYSLIDKTKSVKEKNIIICPIHGKFHMTLDNHINNKQKCGKCTLKRYSFEIFLQMSIEKFGKDSFDFSNTQYKTWEQNITFKCNKCEKLITRQPKYHIFSNGCPHCNQTNKISKPSKHWEKFLNTHPKHIIVTNAIYKNLYTNVTLYCNKIDSNGNKHGEYTATPSSICKSKTCACPKCSNKQKRTTKKCITEFKEKFGDRFIYEKFEYLGKNTSIITCKKHGDFKTNYYRMMSNKHGCPKCATENYYHEEELKKFLIKNLNLQIIHNIRPEWLKNKISLHNQELDIFIPSLNIAIEYQGRHHFIDIYNNNEKFKKTQQLDKEKFIMCKKLGIKIFYFTNDTRNIPTTYIDKIYTDKNELLNEIKKLI